MYLHTKFYEARTLSSIWLKNYLSQMERLSFIKVGMNVHWYLVYNSLNIQSPWNRVQFFFLTKVTELPWATPEQPLVEDTHTTALGSCNSVEVPEVSYSASTRI